jgi:hypothetical protein
MERSSRFQNWFQIVSNVAIVIGLGLVVYELNQSKLVANGQMIDEHASRMSNRWHVMMGEDPRKALAKAALDPAELNEMDAVTLDAYYSDVVSGWANLYFTSGLLGVDRRWRQTVPLEARMVFSSTPGRRWLEALAARNPVFPTPVMELALEAVRDQPGNYFRSTYELLLAKK